MACWEYRTHLWSASASYYIIVLYHEPMNQGVTGRQTCRRTRVSAAVSENAHENRLWRDAGILPAEHPAFRVGKMSSRRFHACSQLSFCRFWQANSQENHEHRGFRRFQDALCCNMLSKSSVEHRKDAEMEPFRASRNGKSRTKLPPDHGRRGRRVTAAGAAGRANASGNQHPHAGRRGQGLFLRNRPGRCAGRSGWRRLSPGRRVSPAQSV